MTKLLLILALIGLAVPSFAQDRREVPVHVNVELTALKANSEEPLANLPFEILAWGLRRGEMHTFAEPIPLETDSSGRATTRLEIPPVVYSKFAELFARWHGDVIGVRVRVRHPEYQFSEINVLIKEDEKRHHGSFTPIPGGTLFGQVVDQEGKPTSAGVSFYGDNPKIGDLIRADERGFFTYHYERAGRVTARARRTNVGVSQRKSQQLTTGLQPTRLRLQLAGAGVLEGRLVDRDGKPVPEVTLVAAREGESDNALGFARGEVTTNGNGEFRFAGLQSGEYRFHYEIGEEQLISTERKFRASSSGIELQHQSSTLQVVLLDESGTQVSLAKYKPFESGRAYSSYALLPLDAQDWSTARHSTFTADNALDRGKPHLSFIAKPGARYGLRLNPKNGPPVWSEAIVSTTEAITRLEVRNRSKADAGSLRIEVEAFPDGHKNRNYAYSIAPVENMKQPITDEFRGSKRSVELGAGEYWIMVSDNSALQREDFVLDCNQGSNQRPLGERRRVVIRAGQETLFLVQPKVGTRVYVDLQLPERVRDDAQLARARIQLTALDGERQLDTHWIALELFLKDALAGTRYSLETFPPGRYRVTVACPDLKTVSQEFDLTAESPAVVLFSLNR